MKRLSSLLSLVVVSVLVMAQTTTKPTSDTVWLGSDKMQFVVCTDTAFINVVNVRRKDGKVYLNLIENLPNVTRNKSYLHMDEPYQDVTNLFFKTQKDTTNETTK